MKEKATELEFLKWFYQHADFGPATGDVVSWMKDQFQLVTRKALPDGYDGEE